MARRSPLLAILLLLASPILAGSTHSGPSRLDRPNVVVIVADDLGWNDVGYHGSDIETPNLDGLAEEGVRLERFYTSPLCSPTRMGLLTGRWPIRWGMMHDGIRSWETEGLPPEEETLAEQFAWEDYSRRAYIGKWHLGHARRDLHPLRQGFTEFYGHYNGQIDDYSTHVRLDEVDWHRDFDPIDEPGYSTHLLSDEAVRFIEDSADGFRGHKRPFLLVLSYNAVHIPLQATQACIDRTGYISNPKRALLAAVVSCLDEGIGRVLTALDDAAISDDTIVWFLSDNGGAPIQGASNAPLRAGKFSVYEGGIRVPSIVRWPRGGLDGGRIVDAHTGYIDVVPTLRRMVRARRPVYRPFDGIDVSDALRANAPMPDRSWFSYRNEFSFRPEIMAINRGPWKLIRHAAPILWDPNFQRPVELYRIPDDPEESNDVADSNPEVVHDLLCRLYSFRSLQPHNGFGNNSPTRPDGWQAPPDWEIPPDPDPHPRYDRSRSDFKKPAAPPATAPGCTSSARPTR